MKDWLTSSWKMLTGIIGVIVILSTVAGGVMTADARYAKTEHVVAIESRLNVKIIQDRIDGIQDRMWKIEDRWNDRYKKEYDKYPDTIIILKAYMDEDARETYRKLEEELEDLETELESYTKTTKKEST